MYVVYKRMYFVFPTSWQVYKHVYDNTFPLNFQLELSSSGNRQQISRHIIHLNEVNNRTDYAMEGMLYYYIIMSLLY